MIDQQLFVFNVAVYLLMLSEGATRGFWMTIESICTSRDRTYVDDQLVHLQDIG